MHAMVQERPVRVERRLAAILAADVAGYSRLMHHDEETTHAKLTALLAESVTPAIAEHGGRIVKNTGDGFLAEFPSAVEAVRAAVQFQTRVNELANAEVVDRRIAFRVGVNIGDVIVEPHDIFGDGVNIAARLESIAEPGGICISSAAYDQVRGKVRIEFTDMGDQDLKNIALPVRAYAVVWDLPGPDFVAPAEVPKPARMLPEGPSIAILPFLNLSSDPEQDYFADGIVEDITMALARFHWLFVIARNSSFTYKGRTVHVKQVGRELGVRYLLNGSLRKAENHIRIVGQLVDTETGINLWTGRFDGELKEIFDLQDQVTACVVGAMAPELERAEIRRAGRKPPASYSAYDHYLRGLASSSRWSREANDKALMHFCQAIELDPKLASSYGMAAWCYARRKANGWMIDPIQESAEAARLARKAVTLGKGDPIALSMGGYVLAFIAREFEDAAAFMDQALAINPNFAKAWIYSAWLRIWRCEPDLVLEHVGHAVRLNPLDPSSFSAKAATAYAHFLAGRYGAASSWAEKSMLENPEFLLAICCAAASSALAGRPEQTRKAMVRLYEQAPNFRVSNLNDLMPFCSPEYLARFTKGLRAAGLPD
jgi:TolB-like protein/class 3 adenylate cyclase/tetratricopeptide (TPR) repeat protein